MGEASSVCRCDEPLIESIRLEEAGEHLPPPVANRSTAIVVAAVVVLLAVALEVRLADVAALIGAPELDFISLMRSSWSLQTEFGVELSLTFTPGEFAWPPGKAQCILECNE